MLDYDNPSIQSLIKSRGWDCLDEFHKIREIYNFVRDEILFGYNADDAIKMLKQSEKLKFKFIFKSMSFK